ncbi:DNA repair photolyase [Friedmanniella endophytica]|uniref:DNA repair photolyase n=1 Tax=Microlunatus kandeliicorticis TaxID=1759536 RepID=A0A7W3IP53_9ACTN|nr:Rv2578c family radical SAM protein [Microlunatus kandeliicorticis]MBA8792652.1 DNA repair photolyase [Microlunatus kandeliicorticis]
MRWSGQQVDATDPGALPGLEGIAGLVRTVQTPEFAGITFHEVLARSALNRVPPASGVPFDWTINPYRGCSHGCTYCFARQTHTYLDLDAGHDFDSRIVVKVNVVEVLERELARASWRGEPVALGTNTDPYQRAEGRYRLMPGIIGALAASRTPFSVLTKGTTARRDLGLLAAAAGDVPVSTAVSIALADEEVHAALEPGAPTPRARLDLVRAIRSTGLPCQVLVAPVLPLITDRDEDLETILAAVADAGATGATVFALHLRPGAREWFGRYLAERHPELVGAYRELYRGGSTVLPSYRHDLARRAEPLLRRYGLQGREARWTRSGHLQPRRSPVPDPTAPEAPTLF